MQRNWRNSATRKDWDPSNITLNWLMRWIVQRKEHFTRRSRRISPVKAGMLNPKKQKTLFWRVDTPSIAPKKMQIIFPTYKETWKWIIKAPNGLTLKPLTNFTRESVGCSVFWVKGSLWAFLGRMYAPSFWTKESQTWRSRIPRENKPTQILWFSVFWNFRF